jgi:hypothetical protein
MSQLQFDANQVKPQEALDPIPKAYYNLRIIESETVPTKDGSGAFLKLTVEVIDGQFASRKVFDRLNLWNVNPVASEIAQRRLSAYCHATGVMIIQDSQQLHGIPFKSLVVVREATSQYDASNEIKAIKHINDPSAGGQAAPQGFTPPTDPAQPGPSAFQPQMAAATQTLATPWNPTFQQAHPASSFAPPTQGFTPPGPQAGPTSPWARK